MPVLPFAKFFKRNKVREHFRALDVAQEFHPEALTLRRSFNNPGMSAIM